MKNRLLFKLILSFVMMVSLACGISDLSGSNSPTQQPGELETAVARSLAETAGVQTAIAQGVAGTMDPGQQRLTQNPPQLQTEHPILTPTLEISPTTERPLVSVSQVTNCRSGPGTSYDWLGALNVGQQAEVFGQDPAKTSWYIRNPNNSSGFCWIYGSFATIIGNSSNIPVYTPMPTPTPARTATFTTAPMDFIVSFKEMDTCGLQYYARFDLYNNSSVTWQSFQTIVTDTVTAQTVTIQYNDFKQFVNCVNMVTQADLTPGETGEANSFLFIANPLGHLLTASIKLCTMDDLGGSCVTKTLSFTP